MDSVGAGADAAASLPYQLIQFPEGDVKDYFYGIQIRMVVAHVLPPDLKLTHRTQ
jgi:hypothetical protein